MGSTQSPGVVGDVAQTFIVGRDGNGRWLAVEVHGRGGGLFASREAAIVYARSETARRPDGVCCVDRPIALL